jgi:hypothetical protein
MFLGRRGTIWCLFARAIAMVTEPQEVFGAATSPLHPYRNEVRTRYQMPTAPVPAKRKKTKKIRSEGESVS